MKALFQIGDHQYESDLTEGLSLSIPMDFNGPQPNHFGAPRAASSTLKLGDFVGDTTKGGSCNVDSLSMIPHCNGTHTETVGHILNEDIFVGHTSPNTLLSATLITVEHEMAKTVKQVHGESYRPALNEEDWVISRAQLEFAFKEIARHERALTDNVTKALILHTTYGQQPLSAQYGKDFEPAFLTVEAMQLIAAKGYDHLLLDLPSVDRMYDEGLLTNHHIFWGVEEGSHSLGADTHQSKTITEMIYVRDEIEDGIYLLNLQTPDLQTDAAPSHPVIFKARCVST